MHLRWKWIAEFICFLRTVEQENLHIQNKWQKYFGAERALIINDDKPAVRKEADGWVVYGTPFSGKTDEQLNRKGKLQGICMLERGKTNEIRRMDPQEAVLL